MDSKAVATKGLKGASGCLLSDLQALPEEAFDRQFGDKCRTVADIIYEVNLVNDHIRMVIAGEEPFAWPEGGWIKAPADFRTKETVVAAFESSISRLMATVEGFTPEQFEEPITIESGETTRFARCQFMTIHMYYHSGQLNFIQTLLGDDAWHWG